VLHVSGAPSRSCVEGVFVFGVRVGLRGRLGLSGRVGSRVEHERDGGLVVAARRLARER